MLLTSLLALAGCGGGGGGDAAGGIANLVGLTVHPSAPRMEVGDTTQFTADGVLLSFEFVDVTNQVAWSVDDGAVLTIDASGVAIGAAEGMAVVTAEADGVVNGQATHYAESATVAVGVLGGSLDPVSLSGTVATGAVAAAGTQVCATVFYEAGESPSLGRLERQTECTITDAGGGFLIPDIHDKIAVLEAFIEDPLGSISTRLKSIFARGDAQAPSQTTNVNEITDGIARDFSSRYGGPSDGGACAEYDAECVADGLAESDSLSDSITDPDISLLPILTSAKDRMARLLDKLVPLDADGNDVDFLTETYDPDPDAGGTDALQEQIGFDYQPDANGTRVTVTNHVGETIADGTFTGDGLEVGDAVTDEEAVRARLVRGGFSDGTGSPTGNVYTCWKNYRDSAGKLALVENTCTASIAACQGAGGEAAPQPHTSPSACQSACARNATPSFYLSSKVGNQYSFAKDSCVADASLFSTTPVDAHPGYTAADACAGGLTEVCAPASIVLAREYIPPEPPVFGQPPDLYTRYQYSAIATYADGSKESLGGFYLSWSLSPPIYGVSVDSTGLLTIQPGVSATTTLSAFHVSGMSAADQLSISNGAESGDGVCDADPSTPCNVEVLTAPVSR